MCWEDCVAILQQLLARFSFCEHSPTVVFWPCRTCRSVEGDIAHPLALRRLIDFRSFRHVPFIAKQVLFRRCRKQQKSIKLGHSCCYHLPRSRSCTIRNRQQNTHGSVTSHNKRNAETRDRGIKRGYCSKLRMRKWRMLTNIVPAASRCGYGIAPLSLTQGRASQCYRLRREVEGTRASG